MASAISAYELPNIHPRNLIIASEMLATMPRRAIFSPSFGVLRIGVFMEVSIEENWEKEIKNSPIMGSSL